MDLFRTNWLVLTENHIKSVIPLSVYLAVISNSQPMSHDGDIIQVAVACDTHDWNWYNRLVVLTGQCSLMLSMHSLQVFRSSGELQILNHVQSNWKTDLFSVN